MTRRLILEWILSKANDVASSYRCFLIDLKNGDDLQASDDWRLMWFHVGKLLAYLDVLDALEEIEKRRSCFCCGDATEGVYYALQ